MSYQDIHTEELATLLDRDNLVIFDSRDDFSFSRGHLNGALRLNDEAIKRLIIEKKRQSPVLIYCYHGNSSRDYCQLLTSMGFAEVYNLQGGWQAWEYYCQSRQVANGW
ncbi:MAG: rhodanese-like domain-containing protein [Candidatus Sedimenticola endophacoides]